MTSHGDPLAAGPALIHIGLLGRFQVRNNSHDIPVTPAQARLLAVLASAAGRLVDKHELGWRIFGREPGRHTDQNLRRHITDVRKALGSVAPAEVSGTPVIVTGKRGTHLAYRLNLDVAHVDAHEFVQLAAATATALRDRQLEQAIGRYLTAAYLWRGTPLADVARPEEFLKGWTDTLISARQTTISCYAEAMIRLGRHREVIPALYSHTATYPGNGGIWQLLIIALYADHRDSDAARAVRTAHQAFDTQGLQPAYFRQLQEHVLRMTLPRD